MINFPIKKLFLLCIILPSTAICGIITSPTDSNLHDASQITFDHLPLGYIKDSATDSSLAIDGVTFTADTLTIDDVSFSNGGDTHWFASGTDYTDPSAEKTVEIEGLSINEGEDAWSFGSGPTIPPLPNKILLQGTFESRTSVIDTPGRLNVIKIEFTQPVIAFGLTIGGNQPNQTLEIYDTDNELIETIIRPASIANYFTGYARDSSADKRIKYLLWGNINSHDRLYIDTLIYKTSPNTLVDIGFIKDLFPIWRWIPPWVPRWIVIPIAIGVIALLRYVIIRRRTNKPTNRN